jgi:16S rRNA (uracil1498-N3)-methyltransferase
MAERYFVENTITGNRAVLAGAEAHHLIHVMRAQPGAEVVLFDGSGAELAAVVQNIARNSVELAVLSRREVDRELPLQLTLGVALPKGDRQKWLVEKAVELGVARIVPLRTARAVAQPGSQTLARLRRTVIEASKQCGRNRLLEVALPQTWSAFVAQSDGVPCRLLAHPHGPGDRIAGLPVADLASCVWLAVGPEGGLTDEEVALAVAAGWRTVDLGPRILRVETAAMLLAAMVAQAALSLNSTSL